MILLPPIISQCNDFNNNNNVMIKKNADLWNALPSFM